MIKGIRQEIRKEVRDGNWKRESVIEGNVFSYSGNIPFQFNRGFGRTAKRSIETLSSLMI